MRRCVLLLLLPALALAALCACAQETPTPPETTPPPETSPAQAETAPAEPVQNSDELLALLEDLEAEDIGYVRCYDGYVRCYDPEEPPSAEELRDAIQNPLARPILHALFTQNGSATDVVWTMECYLAPQWQETYSEDDALYLRAGLEENVVEVFGGANLPGGQLHMENEWLYWLIRTSYDTSDYIDQVPYAPCRSIVSAYYDARLAQVSTEGGFVGWDLTRFSVACYHPDLQDAYAYHIAAALYTDPPEEAIHLLAGGMYVDSALRAHGLDEQRVYMVTIGGEPAGVLRQDWTGTAADDDPLMVFASVEELRAALWTPGMEL